MSYSYIRFSVNLYDAVFSVVGNSHYNGNLIHGSRKAAAGSIPPMRPGEGNRRHA